MGSAVFLHATWMILLRLFLSKLPRVTTSLEFASIRVTASPSPQLAFALSSCNQSGVPSSRCRVRSNYHASHVSTGRCRVAGKEVPSRTSLYSKVRTLSTARTSHGRNNTTTRETTFGRSLGHLLRSTVRMTSSIIDSLRAFPLLATGCRLHSGEYSPGLLPPIGNSRAFPHSAILVLATIGMHRAAHLPKTV